MRSAGDNDAAAICSGRMGVNTRTISAKKAKLLGGGIQRMALNRVTLAGGSTDATMRVQNTNVRDP